MEKLFGIPTVLVIIYKNLTFADQLRLARVNSFLRSIFESFIFPVKYTKLKITTLREMEKLIFSNDENENCLLLTRDELKNFLQYGADEILEMHLRPHASYIHLYKFYSVDIWENLRNLTCLHYTGLILCDKDLLLIVENYPKLSELRLINCKNRANEKMLWFGSGLSLSTLSRMNKLKSLTVEGERRVTIGMSLFYDLITSVPLESLKLKACLKQDMHDNLISKRFHHHLKELEIDLDSESLNFFERAGILKNLVKFEVNISNDVTDSVLQCITNAWQNLKVLSFGSFQNFKNVTRFQIPPTLKELSLGLSKGLKSTHVMDILTKLKLEKLTCKFFGGRRRFKDFKMSPYIEVLNLCGINTIEILSSYSNNNKVKELHWYENQGSASQEADNENVTNKQENLKTCNNLENLIVHVGYIPLEVILELKHLQKPQIIESCYQIDWSYIIGLLKHPTLNKLYINYYSKQLDDAANIPAKGFPSTVTLVHIKFDLLENALDFWLDMLQQNPTMLIKSNILFNFDISFLMKLIQHENFPKDLREIKVCGFNLDCKDLRENFKATIAPLEQTREIYWNNCTLVLSRTQNPNRE